MADPIILTDAIVWLGGYALGNVKQISLALARAELDSGHMGDECEAKYPGLLSPSIEITGDFDGGDAVLAPRTMTPDRTVWPLTVGAPNANGVAPGSDGDAVYTLAGAQYGYETWGPHGQILPYKAKTLPRSDYSIYRQTIMLPRATRIATVTGTARLLGLLATGQKLVSVLHVFSVTGASGSVVVTIESDTAANFPSPVVRITHAAVATAAGVGREVKVLAGPVATDTYWRAVATWTAGTNYSLAVALSIQ